MSAPRRIDPALTTTQRFRQQGCQHALKDTDLPICGCHALAGWAHERTKSAPWPQAGDKAFLSRMNGDFSLEQKKWCKQVRRVCSQVRHQKLRTPIYIMAGRGAKHRLEGLACSIMV